MDDFRFVMAGGLIIEFSAMQDTAALGVDGAEYQTADTGKTDRARAHGTGFQRDIKIVFGNTLCACPCAPGTNDFDLGMGGGVGFQNGIIARGDDFAGFRMDQHGTDGYLVPVGGLAGFFKRQSHIMGIGKGHASFYREKCVTTTDMDAEKERIAKIIARAGICSRRDAERLIAEGRVKVNGQVLETPAFLATVYDDIRVDDQSIPRPEGTRLFLYYKAAGLVTTAHDPQGRDTVFDHLPPDMPRVISVGRLDLNTEGLLLLTNDGELSRYLELPSTGWVRTYRVRAYGSPTEDDLRALSEGISYEGVNYGPINVSVDRGRGDNTWMTMKLTEGKNREIRNVTRAIGMQVNRLIRVSYGPFELGDMHEGEVVEIKTAVLKKEFATFFEGRG